MTLPPLTYAPPSEPLQILYADKDMVVLDKPTGLLSVPGRGAALQDSALLRLRETSPQIQAVHRLDLWTSGLLLFATRRKAESALRTQFQNRLVQKRYLAMVAGQVIAPYGQIVLPLICDWPNRPRQKICHQTGKPAHTLFTVLERHAQTTLLRLTPLTGRSHQLRVHLASIGHPILGDTLYGDSTSSPRLLLHSAQLGVFHPYSDTWTTFHAPCPFAPHITPQILCPNQKSSS